MPSASDTCTFKILLSLPGMQPTYFQNIPSISAQPHPPVMTSPSPSQMSGVTPTSFSHMAFRFILGSLDTPTLQITLISKVPSWCQQADASISGSQGEPAPCVAPRAESHLPDLTELVETRVLGPEKLTAALMRGFREHQWLRARDRGSSQSALYLLEGMRREKEESRPQ